MQTYESQGVLFEHPADWEVNEQKTEEGITLTVSGPGTSFWSVSLYNERPDPSKLLRTAIEAFQGEYEEVDVYPVEKEVSMRIAEGCDLDFVFLDLVNFAFFLTFQTNRNSVFLYGQSGGMEIETIRPILNAITDSFHCVEK